MITLFNLTPHAISLPDRVIPPSGPIARCAEVTAPAGTVDGLELIRRSYGEVTNLPASQADTYYIVSSLVRTALPARLDLLSPGDIIRDANGKIVGVQNLITN